MKRGKVAFYADNVHKSVQISSFEQYITNTAIFNRLHNVYQTSTVYFTYPTLRNKRFEHSMGTMQVCSDMFLSIINNTGARLLGDIKSKLKIILSKIANQCMQSNLYKEKLRNCGDIKKFSEHEYEDVFISKLISKKDSDKVLYFALQAIRLAALMHDIGHPPFSHVVENALMRLLMWIDDEKESGNDILSKANIVEFNEIFDVYSRDYAIHEQIGTKLVDDCLMSKMSGEANSEQDRGYRKSLILLLEFVKAIYAEQLDGLDVEENAVLKLLHTIVSGTIDGDRLDYLVRCYKDVGMQHKIDYRRLLASMIIIKKDDEYKIAIHEKYISIIEDMFEEYRIHYNRIIFHHKCVKMDFLLGEAIFQLGKQYLLSSITESIDDKTHIIPISISGLWLVLDRAVDNSTFVDRFIQWDDNWLLVMLRNYYLKNKVLIAEYNSGANSSEVNDFSQNKEYTSTKIKNLAYINKLLSEILCNEKQYFSLIKRENDIRQIEDAVMDILNDKHEDINCFVQRIKNEGLKVKGQEGIELETKAILQIYEGILQGEDNFIANALNGILKDAFEANLEKRVLENNYIYHIKVINMVNKIAFNAYDTYNKGIFDLYNKTGNLSFENLSSMKEIMVLKNKRRSYFVYFACEDIVGDSKDVDSLNIIVVELIAKSVSETFLNLMIP
ncbi:MAG: HD domain-containing protein [Bacillota bacterium]